MKCCTCSLAYRMLCPGLSVKQINSMTKDEKRAWQCILCVSKKPKRDDQNIPIRSLRHARGAPTDQPKKDIPDIS